MPPAYIITMSNFYRDVKAPPEPPCPPPGQGEERVAFLIHGPGAHNRQDEGGEVEMSKGIKSLMIGLLLGLAVSASAVPSTMNYQGRVRNNAGGAPVTDSTGNSV